MSTFSRRNFLQGSTLLGISVAAAAMTPIAAAAAAPKSCRTIKEVLSMSEVDMAKNSDVVQSAHKTIASAANKIKDTSLRKLILSILDNPAPTIAQGNEASILSALKNENLIAADAKSVFPRIRNKTQSPQPFWSAPGSGYGSHHAYPGGLATHTALNVVSAQALYENYCLINNLELDWDDAVGGEILHDLHKPWVFQWEKDRSCRVEKTLAGTGEHHVLSIAESIKRGVKPSLVVAQACAHEHPSSKQGEALVVGWLKAASIIAGVDPVKRGLLASNQETLPLPRRMEGYVVHLADHDWVISSSACQWSVQALKKLAQEQYNISDEATFNAFRNYVLSNLTAMRLYGILSSQGPKAFANDVARVIKL
ncbi:MAG TPA: metal-dependent phosphohydrolase [Candidatus Aphodousia gallistercoris]|nr:metal-dependent phosphohydrolase [Candidatus Aphodousia gallistercoris]